MAAEKDINKQAEAAEKEKFIKFGSNNGDGVVDITIRNTNSNDNAFSPFLFMIMKFPFLFLIAIFHF